MWLRVAEAALRLITLKKKLIVVYVINGETGPTQLVSMMEVLRSPDVTWHFRQLRGMRLGIVTNGVMYEHGDCDDLESLYCHLVSLAGVVGHTADADNADENDVVVNVDATDAPWRKAAAWRGKLVWRDRLKPQWHDDEELATHVGGLRGVSQSLDMVPGVRERGAVIGDALATL